MELLVIDPFEAIGVGSGSSNILGSDQIRFVSADINQSSGNGGFANETGILSPRHLRRSGGASQYAILGSQDSEQASGKAVWGTAAAFNNLSSGSSPRNIFDVPTGSSGFSHLEIEPDGTVTFLGQSASTDMTSGGYGYFEVVIDLDLQQFSVFYNNQLLFDGVHSFDRIRNFIRFKNRLSVGVGNFSYVDDFYHLGGTTGPFTDRLGPVRAVRAPLISAAEENFIPTGAPNNLSAVDKTSLAEGSYNRSPAGNDVSDRFKIDTSVIPEGKDILGVSHKIYYRKSDIGPRNLDAVVTGPSGANKVSQPLPERLVTFGGHDPMILTQAPGGGVLDIEALEDMEFGYEVKA